MNKLILMTGSSGTIGTALVQEMMRRKLPVIPLDIKPSLWDHAIDRKTLRHNLKYSLDSLRLRQTPGMIIHLAAHARVHDLVVRPDMALENYVMTYNVLEYARQKGIKRIIYASSREIYGESKQNQIRKESDSSVVTIKSPYTASKYGSEALVHAYHECYGIKPVIVRFSNVYGRFDVSERVVPLFIYYALRNRDITIFGKEKKLDFTYTDDAVDGMMAIIRRFDRVSGLTFNLSRGRGERLVDLARIVVEQLKAESKIKLSTKRVGEISSYVGDISLAKKHLGFKPKVLLKDGLVRNIEWYLSVIKNRRIYDYQRRNLLKRGWA